METSFCAATNKRRPMPPYDTMCTPIHARKSSFNMMLLNLEAKVVNRLWALSELS